MRKALGCLRYDSEEERNLIEALFRGPYRLYMNFFQPVMKLVVNLQPSPTEALNSLRQHVYYALINRLFDAYQEKTSRPSLQIQPPKKQAPRSVTSLVRQRSSVRLSGKMI